MPIEVTYEAEAGFLRVTVSGSWPSPVEQATLRSRLLDDGVVTLDTPVLYDVRQLTTLPSRDQVQEAIATAVAQNVAPMKRAFLVATLAQDLIANRIRTLGEREGSSIRVFWEEAAAIQWLTTRKSGR